MTINWSKDKVDWALIKRPFTIPFSSIDPNGDGVAEGSAEDFGNSDFRVSVNTLDRNGTLVITTDTYDFGTKPENTKSFLVWLADEGDGTTPSVLGVQDVFDVGISTIENGQASTEQIAPGMSRSFTLDHADDGSAVLSRMETGIDNTLKMMMYRINFNDYHYIDSRAIRTRISPVSGDDPVQGITITAPSGAQGVVQSVNVGTDPDTGLKQLDVFYEPNQGTIFTDPNDPSNIDFQFDEQMSWDNGAGVVGSGTNNEGSEMFPTGTYRTFNNKVFRLYPDNRSSNYVNVYLGEGDVPRLTTEGSETNIDVGDTNPNHSQDDFAYQWKSELVLFKESSGVDVTDASLRWESNDRVLVDGSILFTSRTTQYPDIKKALFMNQVSNGAQPNSKSHYAMVIVDNSWYYVRVRNANNGKFLVLPIKSWENNKVEAHFLDILLGVDWTHVALFKDGVMIKEEARA